MTGPRKTLCGYWKVWPGSPGLQRSPAFRHPPASSSETLPLAHLQPRLPAASPCCGPLAHCHTPGLRVTSAVNCHSCVSSQISSSAFRPRKDKLPGATYSLAGTLAPFLSPCPPSHPSFPPLTPVPSSKHIDCGSQPLHLSSGWGRHVQASSVGPHTFPPPLSCLQAPSSASHCFSLPGRCPCPGATGANVLHVHPWLRCSRVLSPFSGVQLCATPWTVCRPASSIQGILQAGILEWVALPFFT